MGISLIAQTDDYSAEALARRQHEVAGLPQRIEEVELDRIDPESRAIIKTIRGSTGKEVDDFIPGYMRTMVKHPGIFRCQMDMGTTLFRGEIPPREREIAVLRIGWLLRAPYEWGEHVAIGTRYGLAGDEIAAIRAGGPAGWSAHEAAILAGVDQLLADQTISDATWATLAATWDEAQLIEFPMMVGQYVATAMVQNALRIRLAPTNPGLTAC